MATLYLKTSGGNWNAAGTWSTVNAGGGDSSGPPTAADNCIAELLSGNVTIDSGSVCRGFDTTSGTGSYGGTISWNAITMSIGDGTAAAGNVAFKLNSGVTVTLSNAATSAVSFISTSATAQTITTAGKTLGTVTINGAGSSYTVSDNLTTSGNWTYSAGTTITTTGVTITLSGAARTFAGGGKTYNDVSLTGSGAAVVSGVNTFTNFNRTGTAVTTDVLSISNNFTVTGVLTLAGNSAGNRLLVKSDTVLTARSITNSGATMTWSNVDFRDITLGTSYDASAITGGSGNLGGNTNITFTTGINIYLFTAVSMSFSDTSKWYLGSGGTGGGSTRPPLAQDTAIIDSASVTAASKTLTNDLQYTGNINFTGVTNSPAVVLNTSASEMYGSVTKSNALASWSSGNIAWRNRSNITVTSGGSGWTNTTVACSGATITQGDAYSCAFWNNSSGTWNTGGFNLTFTTNGAHSGNTTLGASTVTMSGTGTVWTAPGGTFSGASATYSITDTSSSSKTFAQGTAKTYYQMNISGGGSGLIIFTGGSTWDRFPQVVGGTKSLRWPAATSNTFTNGTNFGNGSNVLTIDSSSAGSAATFVVTNGSAGIVNCDYLSLKDNTASGPVPFYAGANSTNVSGNTNWTFTAAPSGVKDGTLMMMGV